MPPESDDAPGWEIHERGPRPGGATEGGPGAEGALRGPPGEPIAAALRHPLFPVFGPPPHRPGRRFVRGWQETGPLVTCVELGLHDEPADTLVLVSSSARRLWDDLATD